MLSGFLCFLLFGVCVRTGLDACWMPRVVPHGMGMSQLSWDSYREQQLAQHPCGDSSSQRENQENPVTCRGSKKIIEVVDGMCVRETCRWKGYDTRTNIRKLSFKAEPGHYACRVENARRGLRGSGVRSTPGEADATWIRNNAEPSLAPNRCRMRRIITVNTVGKCIYMQTTTQNVYGCFIDSENQTIPYHEHCMGLSGRRPAL